VTSTDPHRVASQQLLRDHIDARRGRHPGTTGRAVVGAILASIAAGGGRPGMSGTPVISATAEGGGRPGSWCANNRFPAAAKSCTPKSVAAMLGR
jgi:hypothetical protein